MALICMHGIREFNLIEEVDHMVKASNTIPLHRLMRSVLCPLVGFEPFVSSTGQVSFGCIYASFAAYQDVRAQVHANRGLPFMIVAICSYSVSVRSIVFPKQPTVRAAVIFVVVLSSRLQHPTAGIVSFFECTCGFVFGFKIACQFSSCLAGVHMSDQATRVKPNCFHFVRQVTIMQRAGGGSAERQFDESVMHERSMM